MKRRWFVTITGTILTLGFLLSVKLIIALGDELDAPISTKRSSGPIALTSDGGLLLVANPDSNTITLVTTADQTVLNEIPVGIDPTTLEVDEEGGRVFVANRGSDTITVIDLTNQQVTAEIPVGVRPYGVLFDSQKNHLYVTEQGNDTLRIIDTTTLETLSQIAVPDRPTGMALSPNGGTLIITHLLRNTLTLLDLRPFSVFLPLVQDMVTGLNIQNRITQPFSQFLYPQRTIQLFPDSNLIQSIALSPDGAIAYVPHTRSNSGNPALTFDTTVFPMVSLIDVASESHLVGQQFDLGTLDPPGVGLPTEAALSPDGEELWVLNAASNDITVIDIASRQRAAHIEVESYPRGVVISPDGETAFTNNTLSGTVSVIDTSVYSVTKSVPVTEIPLPPLLLRGKILFTSSDDPRMSKNQWIACASCHFEGGHDGRTWLFGFAGPRNTTSLRGMIQTYPLRWSGEWNESADSEFANLKENFGAGLIAGGMNCTISPPDCVNQPPNQALADDLDALAAFIDSLEVNLSPTHSKGELLTAAERNGLALFHGPLLGCLNCHPPPLYTDHQTHDVGTATVGEKIGPAFDTPTLNGLFDSAPYFHDGSAATLRDALMYSSPGGEHDLSGVLSEGEIQDLIAYLLALPFDRSRLTMSP